MILTDGSRQRARWREGDHTIDLFVYSRTFVERALRSQRSDLLTNLLETSAVLYAADGEVAALLDLSRTVAAAGRASQTPEERFEDFKIIDLAQKLRGAEDVDFNLYIGSFVEAFVTKWMHAHGHFSKPLDPLASFEPVAPREYTAILRMVLSSREDLERRRDAVCQLASVFAEEIERLYVVLP